MIHTKVGLTEVIEVEPMCLGIKIVDTSPRNIKEVNYVNGGYMWHYPNGVTYSQGILVSDGKVLSNTQPHKKPAGTLIVYKDGTVAVKELLTINGEKDVHFAVSGCTLYPQIKMTSAGFVGVFTDIARSCNRPVIGYRKKDNKIIIAVRPASTAVRGMITLKNLGCDVGITLDAGGSTALKVRGKMIYNTTRRLHNVITFKE